MRRRDDNGLYYCRWRLAVYLFQYVANLESGHWPPYQVAELLSRVGYRTISWSMAKDDFHTHGRAGIEKLVQATPGCRWPPSFRKFSPRLSKTTYLLILKPPSGTSVMPVTPLTDPSGSSIRLVQEWSWTPHISTCTIVDFSPSNSSRASQNLLVQAV